MPPKRPRLPTNSPPPPPNPNADRYDDLVAALTARLERGRVLDVGCGDGALVTRLRASGFDAVGIDLREPVAAHCVQMSIEEFVADEPFDAVVARLSLHHTAHLGGVFERMRALLIDGGTLVMQEFGWAALSPQLVTWVRGCAHGPGAEPHTVDLWDGTPADVGRRWVTRYGELHSRDALLFAADAFFTRRELVAVPYVAWLIDRPELVESERAALNERRFPPLGFVYVGQAV